MTRSNGNGFVLITMLIFGGGTLIYKGFRRFQKYRKIQDTATSKIASAPQGFVELQGYAWPLKNENIFINFKSQKSIYRNLKLQKQVKQGKSSKWVTIAHIIKEDPFYVLDETGAVLCFPSDFDLDIQTKTMRWNQIDLKEREQILNLCRSQSSDLPALNPGFFSANYRCIENYILLGSPILAHGNLIKRPIHSKEINDPFMGHYWNSLISFKNNKNRKLSLMDLNLDGQISEDESRTGHHSAADMSLRSQDLNSKPIPFFGDLEKHSEHLSLIADSHQEYLLKNLGAFNMLMIFGGAFLIILGLILGFGLSI